MMFFFSFGISRSYKYATDEVIRVSREPKRNVPEEEEEEEEESDAAMDDDLDMAPKPKPKKKKDRKVVPVGRNGIKKKRVVKSRMTVDDKGYMGMYPMLQFHYFITVH